MSHVFNEGLKRLEPIDSQCVYCGVGHSQNMSDNLFIPLFKETDRTNVIVYRQVKFQKISVGVSRCLNCAKTHKAIAPLSWILSIAITLCIFGLFVSIALHVKYIGVIGMFAAIIFSVASLVFGLLKFPVMLEKYFAKRKGILSRRDGAKRYEIIHNLLKDGWSFDQPFA